MKPCQNRNGHIQYLTKVIHIDFESWKNKQLCDSVCNDGENDAAADDDDGVGDGDNGDDVEDIHENDDAGDGDNNENLEKDNHDNDDDN